ncbi:MAG: DUF3108 domain-containing protein [Gemmatimonadetes bacterium]|nr:DUF3108 domain-containing protein [Gemmatimonadota bacterium]
MGGPKAQSRYPGVSTRRQGSSAARRRAVRVVVGALMSWGAAAASLAAQTVSLPSNAASVPWSVGERLVYDVRFGFIKAGTGEMVMRGVESVRGRPAWHGRFTVHGGYLALRVDDVLETWMDAVTLSSLRFEQDFKEIGRERQKTFEIFPDKKTYVQSGKPERPSVAEPLDDGSFLYFIRTVPLEPGQTYEFHRYFIPDRNPVKIRVLRRETVNVPAGTFNCVVLQPVIKAKGIFSENGQAEIWLTDDERRIMVQMKSKLPFGSLNLFLKAATFPSAPDVSK